MSRRVLAAVALVAASAECAGRAGDDTPGRMSVAGARGIVGDEDLAHWRLRLAVPAHGWGLWPRGGDQPIHRDARPGALGCGGVARRLCSADLIGPAP